MHRCRRLPPARGASVPNRGGRQSVVCLLLGAAVAIGFFAHIGGAQAQSYQQVDSLLLEFRTIGSAAGRV
jgi:hypothetical protein